MGMEMGMVGRGKGMRMGMGSLVFAQHRGTVPAHILACAKTSSHPFSPQKNLYSGELIGAAMENKSCCKRVVMNNHAGYFEKLFMLFIRDPKKICF